MRQALADHLAGGCRTARARRDVAPACDEVVPTRETVRDPVHLYASQASRGEEARPVKRFREKREEMGGLGSGRRYRGGSCRNMENYPWLDVLELHRRGLLESPLGQKFSFSWVRVGGPRDGDTVWRVNGRIEPGAVVLSTAVRRELGDGGPLEQRIDLAWTPCRFGGSQPWLVCSGVGNAPKPCGRRVVRLYEAGRYFACRHCHDLTYSSQWEDAERRILMRAQRLRVRLGGSPRICDPFPPKPKGMHWRTYQRLHQLARDAEEALERKTAEIMRQMRGVRQRLAKRGS